MIKHLVLVVFFYLILTPFTYAADMTITCTKNNCSQLPPEPLFSSIRLWEPGMQETRQVTITNTDKHNALRVKNQIENLIIDNTTCQLERQLKLTVTTRDSKNANKMMWQGSIYELASQQSVPIITVPVRSSKNITYTVLFKPQSKNNCQNKSTSFTLGLRFEGNYEPSNASVLGASTTKISTTPLPQIDNLFTLVVVGSAIIATIML